jgi:hypothetical protein
MKYERENTTPIENPSPKQVQSSLDKLSGSKRSFASLSYEGKGFIQMAGGGFSCILEMKIDGILYRASQEEAIVPWKEETALSTSCGEFQVQPNEYFNISQIKEAFVEYLNGNRKLEQWSWHKVEVMS